MSKKRKRLFGLFRSFEGGEQLRNDAASAEKRSDHSYSITREYTVHRELHNGKPLAASDFCHSENGREKSSVQVESNRKIFRQKTNADELQDNKEFQLVDNRHPHIGGNIKVLWGMPGFQKYIQDLFLDTRGGTREGFASDVSVALFRLSSLHDELFPQKVRINKRWDDDWLI